MSHPGRSSHNPEGIPERTVHQASVFEFGPVTFPAYEGATAGLRWWAEEVGAGECRAAYRDPEAMRRILAGTGMVTPTRTITAALGARARLLQAGTTRLTVDHELVRERPSDFRPADSSDGATRARLRELDGRTRTTTRSRGILPNPAHARTFRLPGAGQPPTINLPR